LAGAVVLFALGGLAVASFILAAALLALSILLAKRAKKIYRKEIRAAILGEQMRMQEIWEKREAKWSCEPGDGLHITPYQIDMAHMQAEDHKHILAHEVQQLSYHTEALNALVKEVGDIAGHIDRLALNAAVEAARATDIGHGFAGVVDEICKLSTLSAESARKTAHTIELVNLSIAATLQASAEFTRHDALVGGVIDEALFALQAKERDNKILTQMNVSARQRITDMVQHQADFDTLTNLPNRRGLAVKLFEETASAKLVGGNVTLLHIGLDRFKQINETMGHEVGDLLLLRAAERIRKNIGAADTVARLCADEFVVVINGAASKPYLKLVAKQLVAEMGKPFELNVHTVCVSASIGLASYPSDTDNPEKLLNCAAQAMRASKAGGRNSFQFYSKEFSTSAHEKLLLERDLRDGIARGELELHYQPKVNFADDALIGSEALVRWNCPQRGTMQPDQFIAIAEDCGLIAEIGAWALREACRTASAWNGAGKPLHKVAINMSARQFQAGDLAQTVVNILEETGCCPEWIELEITESLLLDERGDALETLETFRALGISIAIDDFGTGYSALSYLARYPINTLKIDKSFTSQVLADGYHAEVVKAIVSIAHSLNQQVVAEGVETSEQAAALRGYGCHIAQGFLYGKPLEKSVFERLPHSFELERA
jgi:diguanylate cyclase (GGDEF)-like protein